MCVASDPNSSNNCWIDWNSAVLCFKRLFHIGVWTFARFVRPLLATTLYVWEIWSGSNNCSDFEADLWPETGDFGFFWPKIKIKQVPCVIQPETETNNNTSSNISLEWAADRQILALLSTKGVAGNTQTTIPRPRLRHSRLNALRKCKKKKS